MQTSKFRNILSLLFCIVLITVLLSCGKDAAGEASTDKFLKCKLNGKAYNFNYNVNANDKPSEKEIHFVTISGWEKEDMITGFGIGLVVPNEGAKETTYSVAGSLSPELDGDYFIQNMKDGKIISTTVYSGGRSSETSFTLTITSLTKWGVKGTFSGKLKLSGGNTFINVTEGEFSAPYN
ncbi:hypothetical protein [Pedobacter jejuensis]|uniref:DUF5025 domain-containing protein n=1 Tax=Pedobacter jejuensis TaxID=1268550 RepID=A0A3N0C3G7_9SPHI|nr:hypothetical protein [Pedobacter jejuensis]RNL56497.1 hypothetical protein D7004_00995 [Pedobacter jejuensis]